MHLPILKATVFHWVCKLDEVKGMIIVIKKKTRIFVILLLGIVVMVLIPVGLNRYRHNQLNKVIATINGESITYNEFMLFLNDHRANTYNYFHEKYEVNNSKDFWNTDFDGQLPIDFAKKQALHQLTQIKLEQMVAKEYGLINDTSYITFMESLENENKRRERAVNNNEIIYGPVKYDEIEYFSYTHSNLVIELMEILNEELFKLSDDRLYELYIETKEVYKIVDEMRVKKISMSFNDRNKVEILKDIQVVRENLLLGVEIPNMEEQIINESTMKMDSDNNPLVIKNAEKLQVGEVSEIIEENGELIVIKLIDRRDNGYKPFEEVRGSVEKEYMYNKYTEYIEKQMDQVDVIINEKVYEGIGFN